MRVLIAGIFSSFAAFVLLITLLYFKNDIDPFVSKHGDIFGILLMLIFFGTSYLAFKSSGVFSLPNDRHPNCPRLKNRICMYPTCKCKFDQ